MEQLVIHILQPKDNSSNSFTLVLSIYISTFSRFNLELSTKFANMFRASETL